jgi:hypothetical protein
MAGAFRPGHMRDLTALGIEDLLRGALPGDRPSHRRPGLRPRRRTLITSGPARQAHTAGLQSGTYS